MSTSSGGTGGGLSLAPFRATRFAADGDRLAALLSPPYDVIPGAQRSALLAHAPDNVAGLILPQGPTGEPDYPGAAARLLDQLGRGVLRVDREPALYVYELATPAGGITRGLLGALELHAPGDGVVFPHENVMAGPVADRLALMEATDANLEPIYLIYDGGGAASHEVSVATASAPLAAASTPDGVVHRLWAIRDPAALTRIADDLASRTAVIADGHHRYATYLELQRARRDAAGAGPWDRGLTLLVDIAAYGPQVEAIHRVVPGLDYAAAEARLAGWTLDPLPPADIAREAGLVLATPASGFVAVLTDGTRAGVLHSPTRELLDSVFGAEPDGAGHAQGLLESLDTTVVHRVLVEHTWGRPDTTETLLYAHDIGEAIGVARAERGIAILLRPTPVDAVLAIATAGLRMPRKSTLFVPKPASGLVIRRFADA
jgi:uncharacterized protein (DUF1015 family)